MLLISQLKTEGLKKTRSLFERLKWQEKDYGQPFTGTRLLMAALGSLPCVLKSPYLPSLDLRRSSCLYGICVTSFFTYGLYFTTIESKRLHDELPPSNFVYRAIRLQTILLAAPIIAAISIWWDVHNYRGTVQQYIQLQVHFREATGRFLEYRRRKIELFINFFVIVGAATVTLSVLYFLPKAATKPVAVAAVIYGHSIAVALGGYWFGLSLALADAVDDTNTELRKRLTDGGLTPSDLYKFRLVWLSIRRVMDSMATLNSTLCIFHLVTAFVCVAIFHLATFLQMGEYTAAASELSLSSIYVTALFLTCWSSALLHDKLKPMFSNVLANVKWSSYDIGTQREVIMFYVVERARPAVSLLADGTSVINKKMVLSLLHNVTTYIVVLVQLVNQNENFDL